MSNIKIKVIGVSKNAKTGPITQTYSSCNSCPQRCVWQNCACYAKMGPVRLAWDSAVDDIENLGKILQTIPTTNMIRHNVAGDIAIEGTSDIDSELLDMLIKAYKGKKAYTYTHCEVNERNIKLVRKAIKKGFVISFSCETMEQVKKCHEYNVPCVLAVESMQKNTTVKNGIHFTKCPANKKNITCATCQKCANKDRKTVIVFEVHGGGKKKAINKGFLLNI